MMFPNLRTGAIRLAVAAALATQMSVAHCEEMSVKIDNFTFEPAQLTVKVGTTVTWTNADGSGHSVKFADTGDSGKFGNGGTFKRTFDKPGEYSYECGIHSTMKGKVIVQ